MTSTCLSSLPFSLLPMSKPGARFVCQGIGFPDGGCIIQRRPRLGDHEQHVWGQARHDPTSLGVAPGLGPRVVTGIVSLSHFFPTESHGHGQLLAFRASRRCHTAHMERQDGLPQAVLSPPELGWARFCGAVQRAAPKLWLHPRHLC